MACIVYEILMKKWRRVVLSEQNSAVAASTYKNAKTHRALCEVCKDEVPFKMQGLKEISLLSEATFVSASETFRGN
jgi:hypothetical protein